MDARLQSLINDYKAAVLRAITELEASGIPRPATTIEWTCYDVPGRGELTNGGEYFIHGFGCAVRMPGTTVDFDFGTTVKLTASTGIGFQRSLDLNFIRSTASATNQNYVI